MNNKSCFDRIKIGDKAVAYFNDARTWYTRGSDAPPPTAKRVEFLVVDVQLFGRETQITLASDDAYPYFTLDPIRRYDTDYYLEVTNEWYIHNVIKKKT